MSWLARITGDFDMATRLRLHDSYDWHRLAWEAFPGREKEGRCFLSRLDSSPNRLQLLLLSSAEPVRPQRCPETGWAVKTIPPELLGHKTYQFDLLANPTRKVAKEKADGSLSKNGKRLALLRPEEQREWLGRKAEAGGFRLLKDAPVNIDPFVPYHFRRCTDAGLHLGVRFRGMLEVADVSRFAETFHRGIGSAKAFGFGMLLLRPVRLITR